MINHLLLLSLVIGFFTSCSHSLISQGQDGIIVYAIRKENNFSLATQGLVSQGRGDAYDKAQSKIRESYQTRKYRFTSIEAARSFFCKLFQDYIKPFNSNSQLKAYVNNFPLTARDVEIEVRFIDEQGMPLTAPNIAKVKNVDGDILYYSYDSQTKEYALQHQEAYERALIDSASRSGR